MSPHMRVVIDDGGRVAAGFVGSTGDCVVRAVAIATKQKYQTVYDALTDLERSRRKSKHNPRGSKTVREGVQTRSKAFKDYMRSLGWTWTPTMHIGSGCKVHLAAGELPMGRLIVAVSRHYTTVINGVIHDTHDPQRDGEISYGHPPVMDADGQLRNPIISIGGGRCVYGYWSKS
jgi:hypothetical protein